jgi:hypothetical protein
VALDRRDARPVMCVGVLGASSIHLLPKEIDALVFIPFCALMGGVAGAFWHVLFHGFADFPQQESFRGAFLGIVFGIAFIAFGALHA